MKIKNMEREQRIDNEIVIDAYGSEERKLGWYTYLTDEMTFPFTAICVETHPNSPLEPDEQVTVLGVTDYDSWGEVVTVQISWQGRKFAVPLIQLTPDTSDDATLEAIMDWHYWVQQNYLF